MPTSKTPKNSKKSESTPSIAAPGRSQIDEDSSTSKKSEFISYVNPNFNKVQRVTSGLSIISRFLDPRPSQMEGVESIKSVYHERQAIHVTVGDLSPEVAKLRIRNNFLQRVFGILAGQFSVTLLFLLLVYYVPPVLQFFQRYAVIVGTVSLFNYIAIAAALILSTTLRREFPGNLIMMILITIAFSLSVASLSYATRDILCPFYIFAITIVTLFTVMMASCQNYYDMTSVKAISWTAVYITVVSLAATITVERTSNHEEYYLVVVAGVILFLYTWWIMRATRRLTGDAKVELTVEDHIFGALTFYIQLFFVFMVLIEFIKYCRRL